MQTYYAAMDGGITQIRVPATEVKDNKWEGYTVGATVEQLLVNLGATIKKEVI